MISSRHIHPRQMNTILTVLVLSLSLTGFIAAASFQSQWNQAHDRIWIGCEYWANPMENWQIHNGRLECTSAGGNRNVHLLTHQLFDDRAPFSLSVRLGILEKNKTGFAGFRIGIHDDINDYRGNLLWGKGINIGIDINGALIVGSQKIKIDTLPLDDLTLTLNADPADADYKVTAVVFETQTKTQIASLTATLPADQLIGNLALVNNLGPNHKSGSRFWFADWSVSGEKIQAYPDHTFGPILWAMHTLSNSRTSLGVVMKMTAQMPPLGRNDSNTVTLAIMENNNWKTLNTQTIHPDARTATFRIPNWPAQNDIPYKLTYVMKYKDGTQKNYDYTGTVRKNPKNKTLVFAALTCQFHTGFPYTPVVNNLKILNPDLLYFSGDQVYEPNGLYGIIRTPADRAILNYLRKWYLFGWAFGDLMRDRPTLCTPDDHDVFQGNLWGNGGNAVLLKNHESGGYVEPARMVNVVHRTNTSHHPDFYDTTPIQQGITVFYGDMVYGNTSFAIVSDRMFKSGPRNVCHWSGRPDHVTDENLNPKTLDQQGLKLLGDRQIDFLRHWVEDWRSADMKIILSQTVFANIATHHRTPDNFLVADLDSGGWPQSARNLAIETIRKAFALHVSGDQHLTTLVQYGVDAQRDSNWSLCTPAISVCYQRWWRPDERLFPFEHRPSHGLENTGEYIDGLGNRVYVYAVGNPQGTHDDNRYQQEKLRAAGFSIIRINHIQRTYTCESYKFLADLTDNNSRDDMYPGFPHTISQRENYGRKPFGYLKEFSCDITKTPVIKVIDEANNELVYALRMTQNHIRPWVFHNGKYTVIIGDPDQNKWITHKHQTITP